MCAHSSPPQPPAPGPSAHRRAWLLGAACTAAVAAGLAATWRLGRWPGQTPALAPAPAAVTGLDDFCITAPAMAYDARSGLAPDAPRPVPADARCPVCGMYPARYPRWAAQVLYRDQHAHFFDSPVDLLQFLADVGRHRSGHSAADILSRWVSHAGTDTAHAAHAAAWIALESAWFVHGSSAMGPMRTPDLPAFASQAQAQAFSRQRGGQVLAWADITPAIVQSLSTRRKHTLHEQGHAH
ncbi:MAG: nitrous oxide reductase accessory protein NosL [Pseudomonadota bacterium]|nr:nitrous oxide reductase accessory protein NosL [Pseudomonadota bacterium]